MITAWSLQRSHSKLDTCERALFQRCVDCPGARALHFSGYRIGTEYLAEVSKDGALKVRRTEMGNLVLSILGRIGSASSTVGVRHGLGSLRLFGDLVLVCLREDTEADSVTFGDDMFYFYANTCTTIECQATTWKRLSAALSILYKLEGLITISRKRQARADLDGPKSRSLTSTSKRTLSIVGVNVRSHLRVCFLSYW